MKKSILLVVAVLFFSFSCKDAKKCTEDATQMNQVMAIHDEMMPKMGTLGELTESLKSKMEEDGTMQQAYKAGIKDLQTAHTAMMEWMQNFSNRFTTEEILNGETLTAEKQAWLDEEKERVKALREQINTSIKKAEALLAEE